MFVKTPTEIGLLIRDARRNAKLTQADLAVRLGTSQGWVSQVENGKATAEIGMVLAAIAALGLRLDARPVLDAKPNANVTARPSDPSLDDVLKRTRKTQ